MGQRVMASSVRVGRNFIRKGDPIRVRLKEKTIFAGGFTFVGFDISEGQAVVRTPRGIERYVYLDGIKRVAVTKGGERVQ